MARKNTSKKIKPESINRAEVVRRNDNVPNITVGLYEHDEAIKYYIDNTIKPHVIDSNNDSIKVPVIYGNPEKWNSVQKSSFYRDKESKIQIPLIMYRRTSIENDRSISRNLDANNPHIHQYIENSYTRVNKYDAIDRLIGRKPVQELHRIVVPNYVTLTYEFIIWTDFIGQMNKVIEAINYAEGSHWGDPSRFIFSTTIDSFDNIVEVTQDNDRAVRTSFTLRIKGYIIPENIQKAATEQSQKVFTRAVVQFTENIDGTITPTNKPSLIQGIGGGGDSIPQTSTITVNSEAYSTVASGGSDDIPVVNSAATQIGTVTPGGNVTIPDLDITINGSAYGSTPATVDFDVDVVDSSRAPIGSLNAFGEWEVAGAVIGAAELKTGQTISYLTGDDGDLEAGRAVSFSVLNGNNPFGNTNRFTDELGGQTYTNAIVIDWTSYDGSTVLGWYIGDGATRTWANYISWANTLTVGTFLTGWRACNFNELNLIWDKGLTSPFNYSPFNISGRLYWSSTTVRNSTVSAHVVQQNGLANIASKTALYYCFAVRNFTVTGTILT